MHDPRSIRSPSVLLGTVVLGTLVFGVAAVGSAPADPKREVPDYDGRGNPDADAGSWVLWLPRIVLFPLYLTNEYLVRRPLGALLRRAEHDRWSDRAARVFALGGRARSTVLPILRYDRGRLPALGLLYGRDHAFAAGNSVEVALATWGPRSLHVTAVDRLALDVRRPGDAGRARRPGDEDEGEDEGEIETRFELENARDLPFFGLGPDATRRARSRYGLHRIEGSVGHHRALAAHAQLDAAAGARRIRFVEGDCCGDPSLDTRIASGQVVPPPGYRTPYTTAFARLAATLDTRPPGPEPGGGGYLRLEATPSFALQAPRAWLRYGGALGGAVDLTGHGRTLSAELALDLVDAIAGGTVPFTEEPTLGGDRLPGFIAGWLTGASAAAAQLGYTWPVWFGLDGRARLAVGNAFGDHLSGLSPRALRLSGDLGVTTSARGGDGFEIVVGFGTEPFATGADITSVRVAVGSRWGRR